MNWRQLPDSFNFGFDFWECLERFGFANHLHFLHFIPATTVNSIWNNFRRDQNNSHLLIAIHFYRSSKTMQPHNEWLMKANTQLNTTASTPFHIMMNMTAQNSQPFNRWNEILKSSNWVLMGCKNLNLIHCCWLLDVESGCGCTAYKRNSQWKYIYIHFISSLEKVTCTGNDCVCLLWAQEKRAGEQNHVLGTIVSMDQFCSVCYYCRFITVIHKQLRKNRNNTEILE